MPARPERASAGPSFRAGEKCAVAAGVEVPDEPAEPVLELDARPVRALAVDDHDAQILERALEHASAAVPRRAGRRQLVERVDAVLDP